MSFSYDELHVMMEAIHSAIRNVADFPKPGIQFKDITPLLANPRLLRYAVDSLSREWEDAGITKVIGIESRGFILGAMLADELNVGFIPVRKQGKLPFTTIRETYDLEYGTDSIEMHIDALSPNDVVLIHDDVIATGGTAAATHKLVEFTGAKVAGYCFIIDLAFLNGRSKLDSTLPFYSLVQY